MKSLRDIVDGRIEVAAAGTSEGAEKGWDTRGRGRALLQQNGFKKAKADRDFVGVKRYVKTELANVSRPAAQLKEARPGIVHELQVEPDGSWRHYRSTRQQVFPDHIVQEKPLGQSSGKGLSDLEPYLTSGKYKTVRR